METPCWCPWEGHPHGGRKVTETSVICEGKSLSYAFFRINCGTSKIGDLVSKDNTFLESDKIVRSKPSPSQYVLLMGVVSADSKGMALHYQG